MIKIFKKNIVLVLISIALLIPSSVFAHSMQLRLIEPGTLQTEYDGGGFSPRTEVTLYDESGKELETGLVDENGEYHYNKALAFHTAVASDGLGHRAEYESGVEEKSIPKIPVVIGVFVVIGGIFAVYNRRSKS